MHFISLALNYLRQFGSHSSDLNRELFEGRPPATVLLGKPQTVAVPVHSYGLMCYFLIAYLPPIIFRDNIVYRAAC